jgi:hypothetical protein
MVRALVHEFAPELPSSQREKYDTNLIPNSHEIFTKLLRRWQGMEPTGTALA